MKELLNCPHCGDEVEIVEIEPHTHHISFMPDHPGSWYIECACGSGLIDESKEQLITRWNRRTPEPLSPPQALSLEELRERAGKPYYHKSLQGNEDGWHILADFVALNPQDYHYGEWWLGFDREPKEDA